jgi:hypothetical protein
MRLVNVVIGLEVASIIFSIYLFHRAMPPDPLNDANLFLAFACFLLSVILLARKQEKVNVYALLLSVLAILMVSMGSMIKD